MAESGKRARAMSGMERIRRNDVANFCSATCRQNHPNRTTTTIDGTSGCANMPEIMGEAHWLLNDSDVAGSSEYDGIVDDDAAGTTGTGAGDGCGSSKSEAMR